MATATEEASFVREQLEQVFRLFTQKAQQSDEEQKLIENFVEEPRIQYSDIGHFLSFLTVNEKEREEKIEQIANELEPIIREMKHVQQMQD